MQLKSLQFTAHPANSFASEQERQRRRSAVELVLTIVRNSTEQPMLTSVGSHGGQHVARTTVYASHRQGAARRE